MSRSAYLTANLEDILAGADMDAVSRAIEETPGFADLKQLEYEMKYCGNNLTPHDVRILIGFDN